MRYRLEFTEWLRKAPDEVLVMIQGVVASIRKRKYELTVCGYILPVDAWECAVAEELLNRRVDAYEKEVLSQRG